MRKKGWKAVNKTYDYHDTYEAQDVVKRHAPVAFMIGALAGSVAALLLTPRTGAEVRKGIRDGAGKLKRNTRERVGDVSGAVKSAVSEARHTYTDEIGKRHNEQIARRTGA